MRVAASEIAPAGRGREAHTEAQRHGVLFCEPLPPRKPLPAGEEEAHTEARRRGVLLCKPLPGGYYVKTRYESPSPSLTGRLFLTLAQTRLATSPLEVFTS